MSYFNNASIDTHTCGEAAEDAELDRRDGYLSLPTAHAVKHIASDAPSAPAPSDAGRQAVGVAVAATPRNLLDELLYELAVARAARTPIGRREAIEAAWGLVEDYADAEAVCECGYPFDELTGHCDQCLEKAELLAAARAHAGLIALAIDPDMGF